MIFLNPICGRHPFFSEGCLFYLSELRKGSKKRQKHRKMAFFEEKHRKKQKKLLKNLVKPKKLRTFAAAYEK